MRTLLITGADRGLGLGLTKVFLGEGWKVFAGQFMPDWKELEGLKKTYPEALRIVALDVRDQKSVSNCLKVIASEVDYLDMIILNAGIAINIGDIFALEDVQRGVDNFDVNTLGALRVVNESLPLMEDKRSMKRLCFVSSEVGSIGVCHREDGFTYAMSKTALNMGVKLLYGELYPKGYSFRLYHPGWVQSYMSGKINLDATYEPLVTARSAFDQFVEASPREDVLYLRDNEYVTWPF